MPELLNIYCLSGDQAEVGTMPVDQDISQDWLSQSAGTTGWDSKIEDDVCPLWPHRAPPCGLIFN